MERKRNFKPNKGENNMKQIFIATVVIFNMAIAFAADKTQSVLLQVTEKGFEPNQIDVKPGSHVVLKITRKTDATCATQIVVKDRKIKADLPLHKEISVDVGVLKKGEVRFACAMDMITGLIVAK